MVSTEETTGETSYDCEVCGENHPSLQAVRTHLSQAHPEKALWKDKSTLQHLRHEQNLNNREIGEILGCGKSNIRKWTDKLGVKPRVTQKPWNDKETLNHLYHEKEMKYQEMADELGCSWGTIAKKMSEYDINPGHGNRAAAKAKRKKPATFYVHNGYEQWKTSLGADGGDGQWSVKVHQLLACVQNDPHEVFAEDTNVHHGKNAHSTLPPVEHTRANWVENIKVMKSGEHSAYHNKQR